MAHVQWKYCVQNLLRSMFLRMRAFHILRQRDFSCDSSHPGGALWPEPQDLYAETDFLFLVERGILRCATHLTYNPIHVAWLKSKQTQEIMSFIKSAYRHDINRRFKHSPISCSWITFVNNLLYKLPSHHISITLRVELWATRDDKGPYLRYFTGIFSIACRGNL